jgi:hypothetical protein
MNESAPILNNDWGIRESRPKSRGSSKSKSKKNKKASKEGFYLRRALKEQRRKKRKQGKKVVKKILTPKHRDIFETLDAPSNFSFIENTDGLLEYFKLASKNFSERNQVDFNLEGIEQLTPDAIALLIAKVNDVNFTRGLTVKGNKPKNQELNKLFEDSGFLEHVTSAYKPPKNEDNLLIHQVTDKKVQPQVAKILSARAVKHTFKNDKKFQPLFKTIIECMANTDNHASPDRVGVCNYWIFTYCNPKNDVTSFTFLDLGVGIFNSNPVRTYKHKILTTIESATGVGVTLASNVNIVPKLFSGEIYTSRTGDKNRGQGLPSIKEASENKHIKNFKVITNNVRIELPGLTTIPLEHKFNGTLLYWELHK